MTFKLWALGLALGAVVAGAPAAQSDGLDRSVLPIPEPPVPVYTELDARNAKPPPRFEVKAPEGAPNVLIVLIDDMGFGQSSAFGGPIHMPTFEKLAAEGLRVPQRYLSRRCASLWIIGPVRRLTALWRTSPVVTQRSPGDRSDGRPCRSRRRLRSA